MKTSFLFLISFYLSYNTFSQGKGSFTDPRDGKVYKTVKISTQTWMAENLAFKPSSGKYWAYNNNQSNIAKYGYLYTYNTATKVCPAGWILPSIEDWRTLENYLKYQGEKSIVNSSFTSYPGGQYDSNDRTFKEAGRYSYFWTRDGLDEPEVYGLWEVRNDGTIFTEINGYETCGYSIRCIRK